MEKLDNNLINKIDDLILSIKNTETYKEYIHIVDQMNKSNYINDLCNNIRLIQKDILIHPSIYKEEEVNKLIDELNNIPLYKDYIDKTNEINDMLLTIKDKIDNYIEININNI